MEKFVVGEKVYCDALKRNLIIAQKSGQQFWICIDPNLSMNEKRFALFDCYEPRLESGWK